MDFLELVKKRYSTRGFSLKEVEKDKLDKILEAGRVAPTAKNMQPIKLYVVKNKLDDIKDVVQVYGAPLAVVVSIDEELVWKNPNVPGEDSSDIDAAIVCTHMMLEAFNLGVNSCFIKYFKPDELKAKLNMKEKPICVLALGYDDKDYVPSNNHIVRKDIEEIVEFV